MPTNSELKKIGQSQQKMERGRVKKDKWKNKQIGQKSLQGTGGGSTELNYEQIEIVSGNSIEGFGIPGINWVDSLTAAPSLSGENINDQPDTPDGIGIGRKVDDSGLVWVLNIGNATNRFPLVAGTRIISYTTQSVLVDEEGEVSISAYLPASVGV